MDHSYKLPPGTPDTPSFLISSFRRLISSTNFICSLIFPSLWFCSSSAAASQTIEILAFSHIFPCHSRSPLLFSPFSPSPFSSIPIHSHSRSQSPSLPLPPIQPSLHTPVQEGRKQTYHAYHSSNTLSISPQTHRNPLASQFYSPGFDVVAWGCTFGRALLRWGRRSRLGLGRLRSSLRSCLCVCVSMLGRSGKEEERELRGYMAREERG